MYYDVVVMGAGPAGCMAARRLGDAGFKVVLLEREKLPREKPCGGFISPQAVALMEEAFGPVPPACLAQPRKVQGARLLCEGGGDYELPYTGTGISVIRSRLDAHLAASSGAEVLDGCEVDSIELGRFNVRALAMREGRQETLEATYLVAADGADSTALRQLRPEFHRLYAAPRLERTMLVFCEGRLDWDAEWIGLALMLRSTGLARFFVKNGLVGLAVNHDPAMDWRHGFEHLADMLRSRLGLRMEGEAIRQVSASNRMAAGGHFNLGAGCALLAGEAAGLLDAWGFGIRLALESGRLAAESIVESAGERITPHIRYRYRMQEVLEREIRQRRDLAHGVGDLDTASLAAGKSRAARRDRRLLKRRFSG